MSFLPNGSQYIGITKEKSTFKIATLRKKRGGFEVKTLKTLDQPGNFPKDAYLCANIPGRDVLIRQLTLPLTKTKDLFSALDLQIDSLLPYPADQSIYTASIIDKQASSSRMSIASIRKDHFKNALDQFKIEPEHVVCMHWALAAFSTELPECAARLLIVHVGELEVTCSLVQNGNLLKGYTIDTKSDICTEIQKIVLALESSQEAFDSIVLVGVADTALASLVQDATGKRTHFPFSPTLKLSQEELTAFAASIGAAIACTLECNFRQKEFAYPYPWKRLVKPLALYASCIALLSASLFVYGELSIAHKKDVVDAKFQALLAQENFQKERPTTPKDYHHELERVGVAINKKSGAFALHPAVPKVSEMINWLSSLPQMQEVELVALHYQMVSRPQIHQPKERYSVRVSAEFAPPTALEARALQEALFSPNLVIDSKKEVQWSMQKDGSYRAVFYLKDKSRYVS